jgi:adenine/guanine phosphoribosyltransferase-like PRPP-binding protein
VTRRWAGSWVADRLAVAIRSEPGNPVPLTDLVGLAVRRNPRRAHLLVSTVLGKHVPTDPRIVYGASRLLGAQVADALTGSVSTSARDGAQLLAAALRGDGRAADELLRQCHAHAHAHAHTHVATSPAAQSAAAVVLGYAETATALGHGVANALGAPYLHSSRRRVEGAELAGGFEEEHSHATSHLLQPEDRALLASDGPLVLVDDELSTGRTILNTIRALHLAGPTRSRYLVATLIDLRSTADRQDMQDCARELGVCIEVVALAAGTVELPADVLDRGAALVAEIDSRLTAAPSTSAGGQAGAPLTRPVAVRSWSSGTREGGRHGFLPTHRDALERAAAGCAAELASRLSTRAGTGPTRVLVLGFEELMYAPLRIAMALAERFDERSLDHRVEVRYSTTSRSPVLAVDDPGYAIRTRLTFGAHDDPADGPGPRYAYNVAAGADPARGFTDIVLVIDDVADTESLYAPDGLWSQLIANCADAQLVVVPAWRPSQPLGTLASLPVPLRGPGFGSYEPAEVGWLLTDLSTIALEQPTEDREEAIQAGRRHYAESLPIEYQPSADYQQLFDLALERSAREVALAVGVVTELVLTQRGSGAVLASLARAGTPVGILMRRWAAFAHQIELAHYAVSIVRGRGIDQLALRYLARHHDPAAVVFVDGWTGKGAIARELTTAIDQANHDLNLPDANRFSSELAVLADTGSCVTTFGTRDDFLIPSACLNSTVSGLVSRTVLNDELIGPNQFHGAKFYSELAGGDVSRRFLDVVTAQFPFVQGDVGAAVDARAAGAFDPTPTWAGWRTVEGLCVRYGIEDPNLVKPGVGETTRVLLRRVPWKVLVRAGARADLEHVLLLAEQRGVPVEDVEDLSYRCVGLIKPNYSRASTAG